MIYSFLIKDYMKVLIAFVMAVVFLTYPMKIVISENDAVASKTNSHTQSFLENTNKNLIMHRPSTRSASSIDPSLLISAGAELEISCLAKNIYFEAAVESTAGKLAVAHVTHNRVNSRHFPNSYCKVIYEGPTYASGLPKRDRCQFSWYCDGRGDVPFPGKTWDTVQDLANYYYKNASDLRDITDGATHYHADYINDPRWAIYKKKTVKIDTHIFYR